MEIEYRKSVIHQTEGGEDMETEVFLPDFGTGRSSAPLGYGGAGVRWTPLPKAEALTEATAETRL